MAAYLADRSALVRIDQPEGGWLAAEILDGNVRRSSMTDLEIYYSARGPQDLRNVMDERTTGFGLVDTLQADWERAIEVMVLLAESGKHRAVGIPDLLIAAVAERHQLILVHYDGDFDHVGATTNQPTRWLAPRGTW